MTLQMSEHHICLSICPFHRSPGLAAIPPLLKVQASPAVLDFGECVYLAKRTLTNATIYQPISYGAYSAFTAVSGGGCSLRIRMLPLRGQCKLSFLETQVLHWDPQLEGGLGPAHHAGYSLSHHPPSPLLCHFSLTLGMDEVAECPMCDGSLGRSQGGFSEGRGMGSCPVPGEVEAGNRWLKSGRVCGWGRGRQAKSE